MKINNLIDTTPTPSKARLIIGSWPLFILLIYYVYIWLCEVIDLLFYFAGLPQATFFSRLPILFLCAWLGWAIKQKKLIHVNKIKWDRWLVAGIGLVIIFGLARSVYPDTSYDTRNYHLLVQKPGFVNYFATGFGAGNFQSWGFRLADWLFYWPRALLGYRLGTTLNIFFLSLILIHLTHLITQFADDNRVKTLLPPAVWALLLLATEWNSILIIGTYYVDIAAIPLLLEILTLIIHSSPRQPPNIWILAYLGLLGSLTLAVKMTNIVYLLPMALLYIIINYRHVIWQKWLLTAMIAIIPVSIYLLFNFTATGNPIFPYFNQVFHSPYYYNLNFRDYRFGPKNFLQGIFWLGNVITNPLENITEVPNPGRLVILTATLSWLALLGLLIYRLVKRRRQNSYWPIPVLFAAVYLLWSFTTGYARYFAFGWILLQLCLFLLIIEIMQHQRLLGKIGIILSVLVLCYTMMRQYHMILIHGSGWTWTAFNWDSWRANIGQILRDHHYTRVNQWPFPQYFVIPESAITGEVMLANPEAEIITASYVNYLDNNDTYALWQNKMNDALTKPAYSIWRGPLLGSDDEKSFYDQNNLYLNNLESISSFMGERYLVTLEPAYGRQNSFQLIDTTTHLTLPDIGQEYTTMIVQAHLAPYRLEIIVKQDERQLARQTIELAPEEIQYVSMPINPKGAGTLELTLTPTLAGSYIVANPTDLGILIINPH